MALRVLRVALTLALALVLTSVVAPTALPATASSGSPYVFNWTGVPSTPQPWNPRSGFDLVVHDRDFTQTLNQPYSFQAQHGSDCSAFQGFGVGGTHLVQSYADLVFICNNHMMTSINGQGYGEVTFTPAELLDWSNGPVSVTWQIDTLRTSCRDWLSFNVMPFADNLMLTDGIGVDLYGEPRNELLFNSGASCPTSYSGQDIRNFQSAGIPGPGGSVEDVTDTSSPLASKNRQTFQLDISSTHVRFGMPAFNKWFVDGNLSSPLPYNQAIIQFEQHSYTPDKECNATTTFCAANTWHWSNLAISNAIPFTILRADKFQVSGGHTADGIPDTVTLPAPTPADSFVRFEAISATGTVQLSVDGGNSWIRPTRQQASQDAPDGALTDGKVSLYWWPIPAGATQIKFQARDAYWTWNTIRNISVWSAAGAVNVPNAPPPVQNPPPPVVNPPPPVQNPPPPVQNPPPASGGLDPGETSGSGSESGSGEPSSTASEPSQAESDEIGSVLTAELGDLGVIIAEAIHLIRGG